jgi:hypothetical protein
MRRKTVPERMTTHPLFDFQPRHRRPGASQIVFATHRSISNPWPL